ncbi:substrate-binding domain-containing protein [Giesbergeria sinuosa]|uniref:Substrate-binding domain-containing protein n=1 Tax=Giesbergeria sinuosa TaxID=80883 RepID=A0ABV9QC44_9BURK
MQPILHGISSMATRQAFSELLVDWHARGGETTTIESVGGVDAARRVQAGKEAWDVVFLASEALTKLQAAGRVVEGSVLPLMRSGTAVAVPAGAEPPDITSEDAVRAAVLAAPSIGYSTGPSGVALQALLDRWGIATQVSTRTVQAPPGVPVGTLIARGEVALGFQQLAELIHVPGIAIVGLLPPSIAIDTVFSGGIVAGTPHTDAARRLLAFMASPEASQAKQRQGMTPV